MISLCIFSILLSLRKTKPHTDLLSYLVERYLTAQKRVTDLPIYSKFLPRTGTEFSQVYAVLEPCEINEKLTEVRK